MELNKTQYQEVYSKLKLLSIQLHSVFQNNEFSPTDVCKVFKIRSDEALRKLELLHAVGLAIKTFDTGSLKPRKTSSTWRITLNRTHLLEDIDKSIARFQSQIEKLNALKQEILSEKDLNV